MYQPSLGQVLSLSPGTRRRHGLRDATSRSTHRKRRTVPILVAETPAPSPWPLIPPGVGSNQRLRVAAYGTLLCL